MPQQGMLLPTTLCAHSEATWHSAAQRERVRREGRGVGSASKASEDPQGVHVAGRNAQLLPLDERLPLPIAPPNLQPLSNSQTNHPSTNPSIHPHPPTYTAHTARSMHAACAQRAQHAHLHEGLLNAHLLGGAGHVHRHAVTHLGGGQGWSRGRGAAWGAGAGAGSACSGGLGSNGELAHKRLHANTQREGLALEASNDGLHDSAVAGSTSRRLLPCPV